MVTIGNLFSGLYLFIPLNKDYSEEIIRKPWLKELTEFKRRGKGHTWRDDPYLVARKKRYQAAMQALMPGQLDYDQVMEIHGTGVDKIRTQALLKSGRTLVVDPQDTVSSSKGLEVILDPLKKGPKIELSPAKLEFFCSAGKRDSSVITLRNTGT